MEFILAVTQCNKYVKRKSPVELLTAKRKHAICFCCNHCLRYLARGHHLAAVPGDGDTAPEVIITRSIGQVPESTEML